MEGVVAITEMSMGVYGPWWKNDSVDRVEMGWSCAVDGSDGNGRDGVYNPCGLGG